MTDVLDEEAEVEDPAEDLDDPREESESDSLVWSATSIVERHDGVDSSGSNGGLPAKQGRLGTCVCSNVCAKLVKVMKIVDLFKMRLLKLVICASYVKILELC